MKSKNVIRIALGTVSILLILFLAMQFGSEMNWDETDFIVVGLLLFGAGLIFEFIKNKFPKHKIAIGIAVALGVVWIWAELAVGLFTNWGN